MFLPPWFFFAPPDLSLGRILSFGLDVVWFAEFARHAQYDSYEKETKNPRSRHSLFFLSCFLPKARSLLLLFPPARSIMQTRGRKRQKDSALEALPACFGVMKFNEKQSTYLLFFFTNESQEKFGLFSNRLWKCFYREVCDIWKNFATSCVGWSAQLFIRFIILLAIQYFKISSNNPDVGA